MSKIRLDIGRPTPMPGRYRPDYWVVRQEGNLIVRYNNELNRFGWPRLKTIAEKALKECDLWDSHGTHRAEIGNLDGVLYIAFPIKDPAGNVNVCIETQVGFETGLGVKLSDLAEYDLISDGQHKHGIN